MTDRELLENAAKAAGNPIGTSRAGGGLLMANDLYWNPLQSDGDALRLAVRLGLLVDCDDVLKEVEAVLVMRDHDDDYVRISEKYETNPYAATRRAIVRAAAEIGKEMK
jgi:hypothetical protein